MRTTPRSRWFLVLLSLGGLLLAGGMSGCRGSVTTDKGGGNRNEDGANLVERALELLKWRGNEAPNYAEALNLLGTHVKRTADANPELAAKLQFSAAERILLKDHWKLADDELAELDGLTYTPLDAAHLEFCFLLRDAARVTQQNVPAATRRELARWAFAWTAGQVRLQEEKRPALPPEFVLRRGQGTALERALVFLALLQQHDLDGCLLGCRDDKNNLFLWAVGALIEDKGKGTRDVLLFDPRLGMPIPGPGGVATLGEIRANPKLLPADRSDGAPAFRATPEQAARAEVFVAPPLSALSPRMRFLEALLADFDRVRLAYDPAKLTARFGPDRAGVWDAGAADAPARLPRGFLPPNEGGVDRTGRESWYRQKAVPWLTIRQSFPQMPNFEAEGLVHGVVRLMYETYDARPREMLIRGKFDEAARRLVRIADEYQTERETFRDPARFHKIRQAWAEQVRNAYLALASARAAAPGESNNPQVVAAQNQVNELLNDPYLADVAHGADEVGLMKQEQADPKQKARPKRGLLTAVVLQSTLPTLGADTAYLQAQVRQARAELVQGRREHRPDARGQADAARAWKNAQKGWDAYLTDYPLLSQVRARLNYLSRLDPRHELYLGSAVGLLEDLFQDLAMAGQARLLRARALEKAGDAGAAREVLEKMPAELTTLEKDLDGLDASAFRLIRQQVNQRLLPLEQEAARAGPKAEPSPVLTSLRHLSRDLAALEQGAWRDTLRGLRAAAVARLRQLPEAKR